ncbi:hypothetical protein PC121_g1142 [Phytophthora cactorum]|nr:hypothetical protein PC120_g1697 [Phytophthora cactorum]KAG3102653.1 hypothetical protein PC121_g1142 [Phytophthora cactorum]
MSNSGRRILPLRWTVTWTCSSGSSPHSATTTRTQLIDRRLLSRTWFGKVVSSDTTTASGRRLGRARVGGLLHRDDDSDVIQKLVYSATARVPVGDDLGVSGWSSADADALQKLVFLATTAAGCAPRSWSPATTQLLWETWA